MQVLRSVLQHLRDCWKQNFGKKAIVPIENLYGHFPRLQNRTNLKKQFKRFQKVFWLFFASNRNISVGPMMSLETTFQKNSFHPPEKKDFGQFFSNSRLLQTLSNVFLGSTIFLSIYDASSKIISSTPKRLLKSQIFEKKAIFPSEKKVQAISSRLAKEQILGNKIKASRKCFDNFCASF